MFEKDSWVASVYIKDGSIHLHNESKNHTNHSSNIKIFISKIPIDIRQMLYKTKKYVPSFFLSFIFSRLLLISNNITIIVGGVPKSMMLQDGV